MTKDTAGREVVQVVEIQQPFCSLVYGNSPCTAAGPADGKCYNTYATCQDQSNFAASTLPLYFTRGNVSDQNISGVTYAIPSLVSVSTTPTRINLSSANRSASGLGNRASVKIKFKDHPHTDKRVDPYVDGRSWDPYSRSSFWAKWFARNRYRQNITVKVYEGYEGEALGAMTVREYVWDSFTGPDANGNVTVTAKDILAKVEERKALAPAASLGKVHADISSGTSHVECNSATESDYPAAGTLRIGSECMTYTSRANSANGVTFSGLVRGTDGTTAADHGAGDTAQQCLRYTTQRTDDVLEDLLENYAGIPSAKLDTANWAAEYDSFSPSVTLTALITKPTGVNQLVSEISEQSSSYIWWDERDALIKFKVISALNVAPDTLTEESHILDGSLSFRDLPDQRVSQAWVYYLLDDVTRSITDEENWKAYQISVDLNAESDNEFGEKSVRKIFARWLPSDALAVPLANRTLTRYVDVPREARFRLDAKDRTYWTGDTVRLSTDMEVDSFGNRRLATYTIIQAEEVVPGEIAQYMAISASAFGKIYRIMAAGSGDYPGALTAGYTDAYIGNSAGVLSDGEICARIT